MNETAPDEVPEPGNGRCEECGVPLTGHHEPGCSQPCGACAAAAAHAVASADGGQWMRISFMGHIELTGLVTEITIAGHPAFHVDLPEKIWGGNPLAWQEYAASALHGRRPVTEESVRKAWESERAARAAWEAQRHAPAIEAGGGYEDGPF